MIQVGPFEVEHRIGRGGMSDVWRAVHREQGVAVALKVMTANERLDSAFRAAFRREVRAAAGLSHPHVVGIYDYGEVDAEAERASEGQLVGGSPYMAMELAPYGSLNRMRGRVRWPFLKRALLCSLDALSHAHARGIVHRDMKPGNLLAYSKGVVKLTDFGLSHALSWEEVGSTGGTPTYMAPEQFTNRWRDYGPWTDLYGLGVVAWVLVCGRPPFEGPDVDAVMEGHLLREPGAFEPKVVVADGFEDWLRRLLRKPLRARYQRAADASWALRRLVDPDPDLRPPTGNSELSEASEVSGPSSASVSNHPTLIRQTPLPVQETRVRTPQSDLADDDEPGEAGAPRPPPLPPSHRRLQASPAPWLTGTGPSLYGLREVPLVGRPLEQDALWERLHEVHDTGETRVVVLRGPAGCGKSRLARWLCERAHETGGATIWSTTHDAAGGPMHGVRGLLSRALRCQGLSAAEVLERLRRLKGLPDEVLPPLLEWLAPELSRELDPRNRIVAVLRLLAGRCRERPMILWLDDVQHGSTTLELVRRLLAAQAWRAMPILVLLTAQDEALAERPDEAEMLRQLEALPTTSALRVDPLPEALWPRLVRELLPLEPELAARVESRTAGNPLFAVQLLGEWVGSGVLELGHRGYRLKAGARVRLPDDLHEVWSDRVERLLSGGDETWSVALELAAVLGAEVDEREWRAACEAAGVFLSEALIDALVKARLARTDAQGGTGLAFTHSMLRAALERRAADAGRLAVAHRACAEMLVGRVNALDVGRRARHRAGAGDLADALDDFHQAVVADSHAEVRWLVDLVAAWDQADPRTPLQVPAERARARAEGWAAGARAARMCGRTAEAARWGEASEVLCREHGFLDVLARVLQERAALAVDLGRIEEGRARYDEALQAALRARDSTQRLATLLRLALLTQELGNLPRARALFREVRDDAEDHFGAELFEARAQVSLGSVLVAEGQVEAGIASIEAGLPVLQDRASPWDRAQALNLLAEARRAAGDLEGAEESYRAARTLARSVGAWTGVIAELNLALVGFARGRFDAYTATLLRILSWARQDGRPTVEAMTRVCLLRIAAELERWDRFDEHGKALVERLSQTQLVYVDIAQQAQAAGEAALRAGQRARGRRALELALSQYVALGRDDDRERLSEILATAAKGS